MFGLPIIVSQHCEKPPPPGEEARRIVRHGLADVLTWLGEEIGPHPETPIQSAFITNGAVFMSPAARHRLQIESGSR